MEDVEEPQYLGNDILRNDSPLGYGHLIDCRFHVPLIHFTKIRLVDGIVTFLYQYDQGFLRLFLDLSKPLVTIDVEQRNSLSWTLTRSDDRVTCQTYHAIHEQRSTETHENQETREQREERGLGIKYEFLIEPDGNWVPRALTGDGFFCPHNGDNTIISTVENMGSLHAIWLLRQSKIWFADTDNDIIFEAGYKEKKSGKLIPYHSVV